MTKKNEKLDHHMIPGMSQQGNQPILEVADDPDQGGGNHHYRVYDSARNPEFVACDIVFQKGPVNGSAFNGVTNEVLLAILIDRLTGFQDGPYKCSFNHVALEHCKHAMTALHRRTKDRLLRAVEGDFKP